MELPILLFSRDSANLDSPTFELKGQRTITAVGMQPGDYITFEVVKVLASAFSRVCGCRLTAATASVVEGVQELQCPGCSDVDQRPVMLTPQNPNIALDFPQNTLLRAIYHGTGVDMRTVTVWATDTDTPDLTDTMRGCGPRYFTEDELVWRDTGQVRCVAGEGDGSVEVEQINQCGQLRWVVSETLTQNWQPTGLVRCDVNGVDVTEEQINRCGERRWVPSALTQNWTETGQVRCLADGESIEVEEVNRCGDRRWVISATQTQLWMDTGKTRCILLDSDQYPDQTFNADGLPEAIEIEQVNNCGLVRWIFSETLQQQWAATGVHQCGSDDIVRVQYANQCGDKAWIECGAVAWVDTTNLRCVGGTKGDGDGIVEVEQTNQCGHRRWAESEIYTPNWTANGQTRCVGNVVEAQEVNRCGDLRWVATAEFCGNSEHTVLSLTADPASAAEGSQFCWTVTLDSPVIGDAITLLGVLSGTEQAARGYAAPSVTILPGQNSGQLCVTTLDDSTDEANLQLCLTLQPHARVTGIPAPVCVTVTDNDEPVANSVHTITSITPVNANITEGQNASWNVTLNSPVSGANLTVNFALSGSEQAIHGYVAPSLVIPIGSTGGTVTVATTDDVIDEATLQLTLTALTSSRVTGVPAGSTINVADNDDPVPSDSVHTVLSVVAAPLDDIEGATFDWTVTLDSPVANSPLTVVGLLAGSEQGIHAYANPSVVIPIGASSGVLSVTTIDDATIESIRDLCLTVQTSPRITAVPAAVCVQVLDNDELPPAVLPGSFGGMCFVDKPSTALSEYYLTFLADGTVRSKTIIGIGYSSSTWLPVGGDPSDYEVRIDDTSDVALNRDGPTRNAWHNLGATQDFRWQALGPGPVSGNVSGAVRIRRVGETGDDDIATLDPATFVSIGVACP